MANLDKADVEVRDNPGAIPTIIPPSAHPITEKSIDREALKVLYRLRDAGFEGYLVGGGVRDLYLGKRPKDYDISTNARPGQLRKLFRNSRTIGRRFRLVQVFFHGNKIIEVSTLRSQSEYDIKDVETVLPSNNTFGTPAEDAFRRDLTINSLFFEISGDTIIDYVGGVEDLNKGIVRIVGEPEQRIIRDPVRMLRAIRHAARTGFIFDDSTWQAIVNNREKLLHCPPSRIRDELLKDLCSGSAEAWVKICLRSGLWESLFPVYTDFMQGPEREGMVKEIASVFAVVDRLYRLGGDESRRVIPDYMLFAVLLLPWCRRRFGLMDRSVKGGEYHRFSRNIRHELDKVFGEQFNIKKMAKESMTTLFANLAAFHNYSAQGDFPKWLKKKSYFVDCARFSAIYREAYDKVPALSSLFHGEGKEDEPLALQARRGREGSGRSRGRQGGANPAFSSRKSGVFGLRQS